MLGRTTALAGALTVLWTGSALAADFPSCLANIKREALRAGVSQAVVGQAFATVEPNEKVLLASQIQPEFKTPIWDYLGFLVDERRINDGRAMLAQHDAVLRAAEQKYGVDRHVITAVWGVESDYGRSAGKNYLPQALSTLACLGERRRDFWRGELIAALQLVSRGDLKLTELYGSWAGAFGQTQFIPSSYRRLAVDFDGDGRRDLVNSIPDALGSTANYLKRAGWRSGRPWLIEVKVPKGYKGPSGRKAKEPISAWAKRGIRRADGAALTGAGNAGLLLPAGPTGPAFLVFKNFDAIYSYNAAESYALAISHLADRIAGYPAFRTPWPTDDLGLSRDERLELQKLLLAKGYDVGEADGKIGPRSRAAIAEAEKAFGWAPTGRAGRKIYDALKGQ